MDSSLIYGGDIGGTMTNQNGATEIQITTEMLQELFRRLPAAGEVMRTMLVTF